MDLNEVKKYIDDMPDEVLESVAFHMPWSFSSNPQADSDGFPVYSVQDTLVNFSDLQMECWNKFIRNPQINSHVRDVQGNLTGYGFETSCPIPEINEEIESTIIDPRNCLYRNFGKYVARAEVEGELFLSLTLHRNGFVEVDFMDPSTLNGVGKDNSGIITHSSKASMPLIYNFNVNSAVFGAKQIQIPSINLAYYPELIKDAQKQKDCISTRLNSSRSRSRVYKKLGGFKRFIVSWDKGYFTLRNISHIRTTIEWLNHYENLKKWEIDHKKSSGSYLWVVKMEDAKAFRTWLSLSDEEKKLTGIMAKKVPGGTLVLPPGVSIECENPTLTSISEQDTDIMHMITSGLNKPEDMVTGQTKGDTFSGVKASRGPQADRIADEICYFERFLRYDFWRPVFHLKAAIGKFKETFKVNKVIGYTNKEPIFKKQNIPIFKMINFDFPISEVSDMEGKVKGLLGSKHGSVVETLGISRRKVAGLLGFQSYGSIRMEHSEEEEYYPELLPTAEALAVEEMKRPDESDGSAGEPKLKPKKLNKTS